MNALFLKDLAERVVASFAGGVLASLGVVDQLNLADANWSLAFGLGGGAAVVSLLKGVIAKFTGDTDSASLSVGVTPKP